MNTDNIKQEFVVPPLQPLRVTEGWLMLYNSALYEIDPLSEVISEAERWWLCKEDMLQMRHDARNRMLDLGWCREGDLENGNYMLVLHEGDCTGKLLYEKLSTSRLEIVSEIEKILLLVTEGKL
ncbi:hypothetical protein [Desulfotalea psychrophila]|nr:hypothetical protein [Desulfotalea psychrophila]